jgi:HlyD family secretion protein
MHLHIMTIDRGTRNQLLTAVIAAAALSIAALVAATFLAGCSSQKSDDIGASGVIETTDVVVSAKTAGTIVRMKVDEGDRVRTGDTLFVVDDADLELQKDQLLAGLNLTRAQYDLVKNGSRREDVTQAEEALQLAKVNLASYEDDMKRYLDLYQGGAIPEKQYLDAKTRVEAQQRQVAGAQAALDKLRNGSRPEDIQAGQAREDQARAQLAAIDKKIDDSHVLAPVDGVVTERGLELGEMVNVGTNVLTVSKTDLVKLKIYIPQDQLGRVKLGQEADLMIDTFKDKHYRGRVTYISPNAEFTPKNVQTKDDRVKLVFEVQIEVPNPNGELKAGISADAQLLPTSTGTAANDTAGGK